MVNSHGHFVWYELMTTDMEAAKAFYADVVGWGTQDVSTPGMAYTLFTAGGASVSGLMDLPEDARTSGLRPSWIGYVGVNDVDAAAERIKELGGAVHVPPTDIPNISRFSIAVDPQMATIALFKWLNGGQEQPTELDAPGRVGWHELLAADWEQAWTFYRELFGWQKADADTGAVGTYQLFSAGRADDRRHVHQACDGARPVLALLLQHRRHRRGGEAREGRWRPDPRGPDRSAGRQMDRPMHGPSGRHLRAGGKAEPQRYRIFRARRLARSLAVFLTGEKPAWFDVK